MIALLESLLLFVAFVIFGLGATAVLPSSSSAATRLRFAPGVGIGLYLIFAIALSRAGLPVQHFVYPLTVALLLVSIGAIVVRPLRLHWREWTAFVIPLIVAIVLVGSPFLAFGFHWLSYANDDMTNYSLGAERFQESGYFTPPPAQDVTQHRDIAQFYFNMAAVIGERSGAEIILASASSVFGKNPFEIFMPVIFAVFLVIVSAAGLLGLPGSSTLVPLLISTSVAASPLAGLGAFYQLLGQEFGLALGCTLVGALLGSWAEIRSARDLLSRSFVIAVIACGELAAYPELLPFTGLAFVIALIVRFRRVGNRAALAATGLAGAMTFVLLNAQALTMLSLIFKRIGATQGSPDEEAKLFPYYLLPSGPANLWGLQPIAIFHRDPLQSILIACALLLTAIAIGAMVVLLLRSDTPAAPMLCGMVLFCGFAFWHREAFPLYKMAMYVQPFLLAVCVSIVAWVSTRFQWKSSNARIVAIVAPVLFLIAIGLPAQGAYRNASMDRGGGAFEEIPGASRDAILVQNRDLSARTHDSFVVSDATHISLAKIEAGYFRDDRLVFPVADFVTALLPSKNTDVPWGPGFAQRKVLERTLHMLASESQDSAAFDFTPEKRGKHRQSAKFQIDRRIYRVPFARESGFLLANTQRQSIFNRSVESTVQSDLTIVPLDRVANHLAFISTNIGADFGFLTSRKHIGLYQLEHDPYFPGTTMAAVGRYLLFSAEGVHSPVRLILDLSASLNGSGHNHLPLAMAVGTRRVSFHPAGDGSARLISDPLTPVTIEGGRYVGIDMGTSGSYFPDHRKGLMRLYGAHVRIDPRQIVGFARDISVVPADQQLHVAPSSIQNFPQDLGNLGLFYSGIYEDGWIGKVARIGLTSTPSTDALTLRVMVPYIRDARYTSTLSVSIDGSKRGAWPTPLGETMIDVPFAGASKTHDVELHFSRNQALPAPDSRPVSARVEYLGFQ